MPIVGYDAPAGQIWVCGVTGKTQRNRFGDGPDGHYSKEWDLGCYQNALLCYEPEQLGPNAVALNVATVHPPDVAHLHTMRRVQDVNAKLRTTVVGKDCALPGQVRTGWRF